MGNVYKKTQVCLLKGWRQVGKVAHTMSMWDLTTISGPSPKNNINGWKASKNNSLLLCYDRNSSLTIKLTGMKGITHQVKRAFPFVTSLSVLGVKISHMKLSSLISESTFKARRRKEKYSRSTILSSTKLRIIPMAAP